MFSMHSLSVSKYVFCYILILYCFTRNVNVKSMCFICCILVISCCLKHLRVYERKRKNTRKKGRKKISFPTSFSYFTGHCRYISLCPSVKALLSAFVNVNLCTALDNVRYILCTLLSGEERCGLFRNDIA